MSKTKQNHKQSTQQPKTNKTLFMTAIVLFLAIIGAVGIYQNAGPTVTVGEKAVTIQVVDNEDNATTYNINTDAEYLVDAMKQCKGLTFMGTEGPYGIMLQTVNGVTASYEKDQAWWSIYVNDTVGNYGVDQQPVNDGDIFRLEYTTEADLAE